MGHAVADAAAEMKITVGAAVDVGDEIGEALAKCDVIVDFSAHSATRALLERAVAGRKPVVLGTTGHSVDEKKLLLTLAAKIPCVWAGNFSVGVNLLFALTRRAASILGSEYDAEVMEMHHRFKRTPPVAPRPGCSKSSSRSATLHLRRCATVAQASPASANRRRSASTRYAAAMWSVTTP